VGMMRDHRLTSALAADGNPAGAVDARVVTRGSKTVLTATLALAAASWVIAVVQMNGMDMGVATELGSFGFFAAVWVSMMAAMMLPGAGAAVVRHVHVSGRMRGVPQWKSCRPVLSGPRKQEFRCHPAGSGPRPIGIPVR